MNIYFQILSGCGFLISLYALLVRHKVLKEASYTPLCDIGANISCSRALGSKYGKTLGIPNPLAGLVFYVFIFSLSFSYMHLLIYPVTAAVLFSIYLAYISYIRQKNFCLVCTFTYAVNAGLLIIIIAV